MLRTRGRSACTLVRSSVERCSAAAAIGNGSDLLGGNPSYLGGTSGSGSTLRGGSIGAVAPPFASAPLHEQRRFSFKYATKRQHNEIRQPSYIHDKRYGIFSNEHNIGKARRGLPHITPIYTKHMNLWETDTDASTNRFFRNYVFGQREAHLLLGRPHGFEADQAGGRQGDSAFELNTDQRYKGVPRPAITNLHYEPVWNQTLYRNTAHGNHLTDPSSALTAAVLGPELMELRDLKSVEHCKAWFDRLSFLIQQHYDAVGDIGEFRSRHTQHVHEFFVVFHDALSSFDYQDRYLHDQFAKARPPHLNDLFGIFLEMEANYVKEEYCPRCSLPYATTRYCGEGDPNTPYRKHRGRWAPHQHWGKEWYDVVMRRAEALWYRATEDPYFGTTEHTQRQVEALLSVYIKTKQRAKAISFIHALRGSKEFLLGHVRITAAMQKSLDDLLDSTSHEHLLTNAFKADSRAAKYTGDAQSVPHSPLQMRLDMEMNKYRRQQREEGVVRVPPATWKIDTSAIVPYKVDPQTKQVTNWRDVKAGIEQSFLATGLPTEAYTSEERREMLYLKERITSRGARRVQFEAERQAEEAAMTKKYGQSSPATTSDVSWCVFPDQEWYRVFECTAEALKPYGVTHAGQRILVHSRTYADPKAVPHTDPVCNASLLLDTTPEACRVFGDFESGEVLRLTPKEPEGAAAFDVVVVGVDKSGAEAEWCLYAMYCDVVSQTSKGLLNLGTDCLEVLSNYAKVERKRKRAVLAVLDAQRTLQEEHLGQVVGVRGGELYVQWHLQRGGCSELDRSVAVPLGSPERVKHMYKLQTLTDADEASASLQEPPSWRTPFRNDFIDERLKELEQAPFKREQWSSLIQGKYTPKVKKYGYTQHMTQDDFQTKEYMDRLLARQYFHNPQAFTVVPERHEQSVKFMGKWEHQRVCGLPTVDRDELERGWGEAEHISDAEVGAIEQALRDISGRRPGNFVKSPTETQSLRLNESWWTPLEFGWEEHNREQMAFLDSSERRIIESARLPFGGKKPPFGTTYGIGERISDIARDYAQGFGLGPHGHSPQHDTSHFNTLEAEKQRVKALGLGSALVRLFHEKLGNQDIQAWALQQCGDAEVNVRQLLLSVEEWRAKGRAPSLLLCRVLQRYLKEELDTFNSGLPAHVPRLAVPSSAGPATDSGSSSDGSIWLDVDRNAFALEHATQLHRGDSDEAYIIGLVQRAGISGSADGASNALTVGSITDRNFTAYIQQDILQRFHEGLARIVGRGIPSSLIMERTMKSNRGLERESAKMLTLVPVRELAKLLSKMRITTDNISLVIRGLAQCPEKEPLGGDDFAVPVSLIFSWTGPQSNGSVTPSNKQRSSNSNASPSRGSGISVVQQMLDRTRHGTGASSSGKGEGDKMVVQVLEELAWGQDGVAADILYAIEQNKTNPTLRQEFMNIFLPVYSNDYHKVVQMHADYMSGKFVPNITVAIEAFVKFLGNISAHPEQVTGAVEYFEVDNTRRAEGTGQYTQVRLLPPEMGPFQYESTLIESIETAERFRRYGIIAGPARVPVTGFIAANCKSLTYMTHRDKEVVYVTSENDQGLANALRSSALFKSISSNPKMRYMLTESASGDPRRGSSGSAPYPLLVASFNRFFYRVAPMLSFYQSLLKEYGAKMPTTQAEAQMVNAGLARALESEASSTIEQDFRRNAERYWRNVLEARGTEEATTAGVSRGSSGVQGRRPSQQGTGRAGQSGSGSRVGSGEFNLASIVGHRAVAGARSEKNRDPTPALSRSSNKTSTAASSSTRVKDLLGSLKSGGGSDAGRGKVGSRPAGPSSAASGGRGGDSNRNGSKNRGAGGKK